MRVMHRDIHVIPKGILTEIKRWIDQGLHGHLQLNFKDGKIMSVNRVQTLKVETLIINGVAHTSQVDSETNINLTGTGNP